MQKHILAIILAALMLLSLCACAKEDAEATPSAEELTYDGFTSEETSGGAELNDGNLRTVTVSESGTDTVIALDFCIGSNLTAGDTELSLRTLPDYSRTVGIEYAHTEIRFIRVSDQHKSVTSDSRMISTPFDGCLFGTGDWKSESIYIDVIIPCSMHLGELNRSCHFYQY